MKKKISLALILFGVCLSLCSCRVNWFNETYDAPWYVIALPVALVFVVLYIRIFKATYVCPHCKTEFKPKWYQLSITVHMMGKRLAKCPTCGKKSFCERIK